MKAESVLDILSDGAAFQTAVAPKVDGADSSITGPQGLLLSHVATVTIPNQTDVVSNSAIFIYLQSRNYVRAKRIRLRNQRTLLIRTDIRWISGLMNNGAPDRC